MESIKSTRYRQINTLCSLVKQYSGNLKYLKDKYLITVVGLCGSGKSTLINHSLGNELTIKKINGIAQVVLKTEGSTTSQNISKFAKIGSDFTNSCTNHPMLYEVEEYKDLVICDTQGYFPGRESYSGGDILHELYLNAAKAVVSIVFVISKGDIDSQRGGGMHYMFQQFDRFSHFDEVKNHIQFVVNYKNVLTDELDELYDQLAQFDKENIQKYQSKEYITEVQKPKVKFFESILGKNHYKDQNKFQNFQKKVILCSKTQLTKSKSKLKTQFFQMIKNKIENNTYFNFQFSNQMKSFSSFISKDLLLIKTKLETCSKKSQIYYKTKIIQSTLWSLSKQGADNEISKEQLLNNILFKTTNDIRDTQNIINGITTQLQEMEAKNDELIVIGFFQPTQAMIDSLPLLSVTLKVDHKITTVIKILEGFEIMQESLDSENMLYEIKIRALPNIERKALIKVYTTYEIFNRNISNILVSTRSHLLNKMKSFSLLDSPQFKQQLESLIRILKTSPKKQNIIAKFIKNYSMSKEEMIESIPKLNQMLLFYNQVQLVPYLYKSKTMIQQLLNNIYLDEFRKIKFLNLQNKSQGYCCLDFHIIEQPIYLQCGHCYEAYCYKKFYDNSIRYKKQKICAACGLINQSLDNPFKQQVMVERSLREEDYQFLKKQTQRVYNLNSQ